MSNNLEFAQVLQGALDGQMVQQATSGWMERNAGLVRYLGGNEVRIPVSTMTGLGDYDRENGKYPAGNVSLRYENRKLTMDRAAQFYFDRNDVDETNYLMEAAAVMSRFQAEHVIPEVDAYRYSTIAREVMAAGSQVDKALNKSDVLSDILSSLRGLQDRTGICKKDFVITTSFEVFEMLEQSEEITKFMHVQDFEKGDLTTEVSAINGVPIIAVPSARMKTSFEFGTGAYDDFGFTPACDARDINYIIMPRFVPIAVSKTDSLKIFNPEQNQDGDGWKTQYRKYHDLWLKEQDIEKVVVSIK